MRTNHRRPKRRGPSDKNSAFQPRSLRRHDSSPRSLTTMTKEQRIRMNERSPCLRRMVGKVAILSVCVGVTFTGKAAFAFVPNHRRLSTHRARYTRRNRPSQTIVSSSKTIAEPARPMNMTSNNNNIEVTDLVDPQTLHRNNNKREYPSGEDFFHGDGISGMMSARLNGDMMDLEMLMNDIDGDEIMNTGYANGVQPPGGNRTNNRFEQTRESSGSPEPQTPDSSLVPAKDIIDIDVNGIIGGDSDTKVAQISKTRTSLFRRVRPFRRIRRLFGSSASEEEINPNVNITTIDLQASYDADDEEEIDDDSGNNKMPSLRQLWKKRHARTLEEGIRREQKNKLSFLMNKALITARSSSEKTYVERSLMGLINGLAEEVEDLDIEVNTRSKTPLWRKEVEEIRINFSRLGFRPIQITGTTSLVEIVDKDEEVVPTKNVVVDTVVTTEASSENSTDSKQDETDGKESPELMTFVDCPDEGFDRIDEDGSGTLDSEELAQALKSISGIKTDKESIEELASDLVQLYDVNGDGAVDREEYKRMVEDMAKLRELKKGESKENKTNPFTAMKDSIQSVSEGISNRAGEVVSAARNKYFSGKEAEMEQTEIGSIVLSNVNLDLRRLVFGAVPVIKKITPGGPLILEPFTATVTASFKPEDVLGSFLIDAALRRLVARVLRVRVRSYRDLTEGALFKGRQWKMTSKAAPVVEVLGLSNVVFDSKDKMVITGRARIRADPDAPIVTSTFKLRTKIGTRKNGQVIKLKEPELAFVFECPKALERGLETVCKTLGLPPPQRPEPYYSFFPIYSPFKVDDDAGGFDMGEDNCIRSIYIKNGKLRFEMSVVLRPGRFLGNHYLAFTVPQRTFIITMDRVWNGVRAARENKQVADRAKKLKKAEEKRKKKGAVDTSDNGLDDDDDDEEQEIETTPELTVVPARSTPRRRFFKTIKDNTPKPKSFYTRFVEGYTMLEREAEANNERISNDISDWFGRQVRGNDAASTSTDDDDEDDEDEET